MPTEADIRRQQRIDGVPAALFDPEWKERLPRRRKAFVGFQKKPEPGLLRWWGVAKSLARAGAGPVVLLRTQKIRN
jgi:hypothetical protein